MAELESLPNIRAAARRDSCLAGRKPLPSDESRHPAWGVYADGRGISSNGLVTGFANIASGPGGNRPFLYQDGVLTNLDPLGQSIDSRGFAINSSGQVTGFFQAPGSSPAHAFLYSDGVITDIAAGDSRNSIGQGINDRGQIVGYFQDRTLPNTSQAFLYSNGAFSNLGTLPGRPSSQAYGISQNGLITGSSGTGTNAHAFLYQGGQMIDLGTFDSSSSFGYAVNDHGEVVGSLGVLNERPRAFLYRDGQMIDLNVLSNATCEGPMNQRFGFAHGINNPGQVVGKLCIRDYPFIYDNGVIQNLNDLIGPTLGMVLSVAYGINDNGQIVATGNTVNTGPAGRAFLLTPTIPVPEPSTLALFGVALLGLGAWAYHCRGLPH